MDEHHSNARRPTALAAKVLADKRRSHVGCMVRDLSDGGAKIELSEDTPLPYEFELEIPDMSLCVRTRVAWTNGRSYGLMFIEKPRITEDTGPSGLLPETDPIPDAEARALTLHLSETEHERLRRFSFERRLSYQEVIERALRAYLNQQELGL
ncbi:PilZ domain-containing protein [Microvirga aerophila]|uniref:PilZ domain-containing protein n=1 Tax=Microvirga aerophila TaxID=670291 RepID=A0A512BV67_9HYPH|nr:PilZ domain-containing protein [Microvirga aerophila]GEO15805.1 hypothetical protein MAE02_35010 [Microvirga aerophila]